MIKIINYLFKKNNTNIKIDDIDSIFQDGVLFPKFVEIALDIGSVPKINKCPKNNFQINDNNNSALQFLFKNNKDIDKIKPTFNSICEKENLLKLILTKQCFKIDKKKIIEDCKLIISKKYNLTKINNMINEQLLIELLNVLTDGMVQSYSSIQNFDQQLLIDSFEKAKVPLVIDISSFTNQYIFTFHIQLSIILDFFSEKINQITKFVDEKSKEEKPNEKKTEEKQKKVDKIDENRSKEDKISEEKQKGEECLKKVIKKKIKSKDEPISKQSKNQNEINDQPKEPSLINQMELAEINRQNMLRIPNKTSINEVPILKVISALYGEKYSENMKVFFDSDHLLRFAELILKENKNDIDVIMNQAKTSDEKLDDLINYLLDSNEPSFNFLLFNFKDKKYAKYSAIMFYTTLLNNHFLIDSKNKLFERCTTILFGNIRNNDTFYAIYQKDLKKNKDPYKNLNILLQWKTYLALANFVKKRNTHYKYDKHKDDDYYFVDNKIPQVIDEQYLSNYVKNIPEAAFYQLQFIFNALDNRSFVYHFIECFLKAERIIKRIKLPRFDKLSENIKHKLISSIIQNKRYNEFVPNENDSLKQVVDVKTSLENESSEIKNENYVSFDDETFIDEPLLFETFKDRRRIESLHLESSFRDKRKGMNLTLNTPESFWNYVTKNTSYEDGILIENIDNDISKNKWKSNISNLCRTVNISRNQHDILFNKNQSLEKKSKLYKFFYYDELSSQWTMDYEDINSFFIEKNLNNENSEIKTPLIMLSNSFENDLITINSNFLNLSYPDLDDDKIYIYATCDKILSSMQFDLESVKQVGYLKSKPIFLLLHVPKSKLNMLKNDNIKLIIMKILYFLSFICDINITVLNKDHYEDQISLIRSIQKIKRSYDIKANNMVEGLDRINNNGKNKKFKDVDFKDLSSDGDDDEDNINYNKISKKISLTEIQKENDRNELVNSVTLNLLISSHKLKHIILINDKSISGDYKNPIDNDFNQLIKQKINILDAQVDYINIDDPLTYRNFLNCLTNLAKEVNYYPKNVMKKLKLISMTYYCNMYFNLKSKDNFGGDLEIALKKRFEQLKLLSCDQSNKFTLILKLDKEISQFFPSIDTLFFNRCAHILTKIRDEVTQKNQELIKSELEISSENHLNYLNKIINEKPFLFEKQIDIENSHFIFLKNEFFDIIHYLYEEKDLIHIFTGNHKVLDDQILKDTQRINQIIDDFNNRLFSMKEPKMIDISDEILNGTNYTIRETEQIREIEVLVKAGHLQEEIEQDF